MRRREHLAAFSATSEIFRVSPATGDHRRSRCFSGPDFIIEVEAIAFVDN